jgi:hypothetical protein
MLNNQYSIDDSQWMEDDLKIAHCLLNIEYYYLSTKYLIINNQGNMTFTPELRVLSLPDAEDYPRDIPLRVCQIEEIHKME